TQPPSRVKPYFQRLFEAPTGLFALPLALSMEAHYRELKLSGKRKYAEKPVFYDFQVRMPIYPTKSPASAGL
ncbi:hypothetical protein, partial [Aeromonas tecta]